MRTSFAYMPTGERAVNRFGSCGVLALSAATSMPYENATKFVFKHGLEAGSQTDESGFKHVVGINSVKMIEPVLKKLGRTGGKIHTFGAFNKHKSLTCEGIEVVEHKNSQLKTFAKKFPRGRYIIVIMGHAVACVNGVIYDNNNNEITWNKNVMFALEVGTR